MFCVLWLPTSPWTRTFKYKLIATVASSPPISSSLQRFWAACCGALRSVLQARRAGGHETSDLRAQKLEQLDLPQAGRGGQAPGLHCSHLQPDASDGHVDGKAPYEEEPWPEGGCGAAIRLGSPRWNTRLSSRAVALSIYSGPGVQEPIFLHSGHPITHSLEMLDGKFRN